MKFSAGKESKSLLNQMHSGDHLDILYKCYIRIYMEGQGSLLNILLCSVPEYSQSCVGRQTLVGQCEFPFCLHSLNPTSCFSLLCPSANFWCNLSVFFYQISLKKFNSNPCFLQSMKQCKNT